MTIASPSAGYLHDAELRRYLEEAASRPSSGSQSFFDLVKKSELSLDESGQIVFPLLPVRSRQASSEWSKPSEPSTVTMTETVTCAADPADAAKDLSAFVEAYGRSWRDQHLQKWQAELLKVIENEDGPLKARFGTPLRLRLSDHLRAYDLTRGEYGAPGGRGKKRPSRAPAAERHCVLPHTLVGSDGQPPQCADPV